MDHTYRHSRYQFRKNTIESEDALLIGQQIWDRVKQLPKIIEVGKNIRLPSYGVEHNWTKQSILWKLHYQKDHLVHRCLNVVHVKKNVFDNIVHIMMNSDQIKDNEKAMMDLEEYYRHPELNLQPLRDGRWSKPKASYMLTSMQRQDVCKWVQELKMPNGYASNLGRCVNVA